MLKQANWRTSFVRPLPSCTDLFILQEVQLAAQIGPTYTDLPIQPP
jgi:hypothetical protein